MAAKVKKETPLMKQYNGIKAKYPDAMLLFRVGDFYETFGEDAVKAAKVLNITLTKRGNGSAHETALAGFPYHSLNTYLPKLVKAGMRVAICDQLEAPSKEKKIVKRGVTELVTPGVSLNDEVLQSNKNNFLAAIHMDKKGKNIGVSFLDISTGEYLTSQGNAAYIDKLLQNLQPSEVLIHKQNKQKFLEHFGAIWHCFYLEDWIFQEDYSREILNKHFNTSSLKGFGIDNLQQGVIACGAILHYLSETHHSNLEHINKIERIAEDEFVWMDRFTIRNLELYQGTSVESVTLLDVIDTTLSPMGARLLKRWLALPLNNKDKIFKRQEVVHYLLNDAEFLDTICYQLDQISDIERLISKVATGKINPREVVLLKDSLKAIIPIHTACTNAENTIVKEYGEQFADCSSIIERIEKVVNEEAPVHISKGNAIREGVSESLDEYRYIANSGKEYLDNMLARETERTNIPSLKIGFNNVFGYYIEVRNTHKDKVPEEWNRKQTLVNAERYITEELKEYESKILSAEEKIGALELEIYQSLLYYLTGQIAPVKQNATILAALDCLQSFAKNAIKNNYVRPAMEDSSDLEITLGRHPVIEKQLPVSEPYIANDVLLNRTEQQIIMITGPNMSGKSAILRQTALIVLLAQMGSYVPAKYAKIGVVDKIFTRVGASDNISMGESTFMVEMNETANILNNLSEKSLILLDEIGRGTSTYDGISIAWAIAEYLHEHPTKAKTLFATHYHELNDMTETFERIKNYNVSVKEMKDKVLFLRKLVPGGSEHSFGIHVAKLAGMPSTVLHRAKKMLAKLETSHASEDIKKKLAKEPKEDYQLSFIQLDDPLLEEIKEEILSTNIDALTPIEALMKLNEIKRMLSKK